MRFRKAMPLVNAALALALAATSTFFPAEATALPPDQPQTSTVVAAGSRTNATSASAIDPLATPLSVSLQQSTFDPATAAAGLVVTVTVRNNLGPVVAPPLSTGQNITDTVAAMRAVDFAADPNTLRELVQQSVAHMMATNYGTGGGGTSPVTLLAGWAAHAVTARPSVSSPTSEVPSDKRRVLGAGCFNMAILSLSGWL